MQSNTLTWGHTKPAVPSDTICIGLAAFQECDVRDNHCTSRGKSQTNRSRISDEPAM